MIKKLYHASYNVFREKILSEGLQVKQSSNWHDMKNSNFIFLANNPDVAVLFAETSDVDDVIFNSGICLFEIDVSDIDETLIQKDPNIIFYEDIYSFVYPKNIPPSALKLIPSDSF